jgi:hypothetical protein
VLLPGAADAALFSAHPEPDEERARELLAPLEQVLHEDALLLEPGPDPLPDFIGSHSLFLQCN